MHEERYPREILCRHQISKEYYLLRKPGSTAAYDDAMGPLPAFWVTNGRPIQRIKLESLAFVPPYHATDRPGTAWARAQPWEPIAAYTPLGFCGYLGWILLEDPVS